MLDDKAARRKILTVAVVYSIDTTSSMSSRDELLNAIALWQEDCCWQTEDAGLAHCFGQDF